MATFKHSGNAGDILYSRYAIKSSTLREEKHILYIALDVRANYGGREHSLGGVMCNRKVFDMLHPLLMATNLFKKVAVWQGEEVDYDLDKFRKANIDLGRGDITKWYSVVYPDLIPYTHVKLLRPTYTEDWINRNVTPNPYIVVNRTFRYRNADVRYKSLNDYGGDIIFMGLPDEYEDFKLRVPKAIYKPVTDFLEAAFIIDGSECFIGNQSMMFAIAELLNHTRILEQFKHAPNVIPNGGKWFTVINEHYFRDALLLSDLI